MGRCEGDPRETRTKTEKVRSPTENEIAEVDTDGITRAKAETRAEANVHARIFESKGKDQGKTRNKGKYLGKA